MYFIIFKLNTKNDLFFCINTLLKMVKQLLFTLTDIDVKSIDRKYNLSLQSNLTDFEVEDEDEVSKKTTKITKITELNSISHPPKNISFLDDMKNTVKCNISMIDFKTHNKVNKFENINYCCYWCRNHFDNIPLGCPIDHVPDVAKKEYYSEITKDNYIITQSINHDKNKRDLENDERFTVETYDYFITDGVFCSFNCIKSFIRVNNKDIFYKNSNMLINIIYKKLTDSDYNSVIPAPHWRILVEYGGHLNIKDFRKNFNNSEYKNKGIIKNMNSVAHLFEKKFKI